MKPERKMPRITAWMKEQFKEEIKELREQGVSEKDIRRSMLDAIREILSDPEERA